MNENGKMGIRKLIRFRNFEIRREAQKINVLIRCVPLYTNLGIFPVNKFRVV